MPTIKVSEEMYRELMSLGKAKAEEGWERVCGNYIRVSSARVDCGAAYPIRISILGDVTGGRERCAYTEDISTPLPGSTLNLREAKELAAAILELVAVIEEKQCET